MLLGLPPLHTMIEAKALAGTNRLNSSEPHEPRVAECGHTNLGWGMEKEPILAMGTDKITPIYSFYKPFTIIFSD
jgi:hypothetical protein